MRALVYDRYGGPEGLRLEEQPVPVPGQGEVLVRVRACSINLSDWECLTGRPLYGRISGLFRPGRRVLGSDIAGVVESVGEGVTDFVVGDEVVGDNLMKKGGFAEYALLPATTLANKPAALSFVQASTVPQAGAIAHQGTAGIEPGQRVLINGAGGGSGAFAIQLAKQAGAHVTGVDNSDKLAHMAAVGADEVIDYRAVDFAKSGRTWDHILDLVATRSAHAVSKALPKGGRYWCVGGSVPTILRILVGGLVMGPVVKKRIGVLAVNDGPQHFGPVLDLCAREKLDVHVHRTFSLEEAAEAMRMVGEGEALGKVVVEVT